MVTTLWSRVLIQLLLEKASQQLPSALYRLFKHTLARKQLRVSDSLHRDLLSVSKEVPQVVATHKLSQWRSSIFTLPATSTPSVLQIICLRLPLRLACITRPSKVINHFFRDCAHLRRMALESSHQSCTLASKNWASQRPIPTNSRRMRSPASHVLISTPQRLHGTACWMFATDS